MYSDNWYNSGDMVPDQVSPASDAVPLADSGAGVAGIQNDYVRGDHQHPLQVSSALPSADTETGEVGTAATYARSDHTHHVNLSNDVPLKDSGTGTACTSNIYASAQNQHPLNVDPTVANVLLVNAAAAVNAHFREILLIYQPLTHIQLCLQGKENIRLNLQTANGNTFTFNGQVIAGGLVNYSQGNTILWGAKSLGTDGGFYNDGTTVFWRDHALQFNPFYQNQ
ncbi:MAG: hypothetical protein EZS28_002767 [Streblomastix strix]|uniref:Uncharacterized protein n=1 Tax=Streblomastix strix TaxID=222440 RepID=A0A5J4X3C5_9EUKA|nr:MAG: hypothetical protein EZS28_002767 [Streblomastix strix]